MIDHLWQSTLFAIVIALVMPLFKRQSAALRFWLWFAASMKFLFPFSLLVWLGGFLPALPERAPLLAAESLVMTPVLIAPPVALMPAMPWLWMAWSAGALFLAVRWLRRWRNLHAALRGAPDLMLDAPVPVKAVASFLEPGLVGILRPVIMMPRGVAEHLSPPEMRAVLAHETAHLSRRDNLWASIQMLVEILFWFHPLVWWIGTRLVVERERACDEAVLAQGTAPRAYAQGILKICRFHLQPSLSCAAGVSGGNLTARVSAIMSNRGSDNADGARILLLGGLGFAALLLPLLAGVPGSAPVNALARQVASTVLYAPGLLALPQMEFITPSTPHVEPPVIRVVEAPPAPPPVEKPAPAARIAVAPVAEKKADAIVTNAGLPQSDQVRTESASPAAFGRTLYSEFQARKYVESVGYYTRLRRMEKDENGLWRGTAIKGGTFGAFRIEETGKVTFVPSPQGPAIPMTVSAAAPEAAPAPEDAMVCRGRQPLSGTRLMGPSVCLKASQWAALHAEGRTMGPDGRMTVAIANYERVRSITPPVCQRSVPPGGITNPAPACF